LDRLRPDDPEIEGALALVLLTDARREARIGANGATVPPEQQNRILWDTYKVKEGQELLAQAVERGRPGPYQIKAAIADCHMAESTPDWKQISLLYGSLWLHEPTTVVALNWAVVFAKLGQLDLATNKLEELAEELKDFQPRFMQRTLTFSCWQNGLMKRDLNTIRRLSLRRMSRIGFFC